MRQGNFGGDAAVALGLSSNAIRFYRANRGTLRVHVSIVRNGFEPVAIEYRNAIT